MHRRTEQFVLSRRKPSVRFPERETAKEPRRIQELLSVIRSREFGGELNQIVWEPHMPQRENVHPSSGIENPSSTEICLLILGQSRATAVTTAFGDTQPVQKTVLRDQRC